MGTSPSYSMWDSRDVLTNPWDMGQQACPHRVMGCRALGMSPRAVGQWDDTLHPGAVRGGEWGSAPTLPPWAEPPGP